MAEAYPQSWASHGGGVVALCLLAVSEAIRGSKLTHCSLNLFWDLRDTEMLQISIFIANYFNRFFNKCLPIAPAVP